MSRPKSILLTAASIAAFACSSGPRRPEESEIANWLVPGTVAVAGMDLNRFRAGPLSRALPPEWVTILEPFRQAGRAWVVYDGKDVLVIASGHFPPAPPGAILFGNSLALAGPTSAITAAEGQYAAGRTGAVGLWEKTDQLRNEPIWAVVRGDARLPLRGNSANLQRALQFTEYTAASATWDSGVRVRLTGYCPTADKAQQLEESLRAMVTLGKKAVPAANLGAALDSIRIDRRESTVLVSFTAHPEALHEILR